MDNIMETSQIYIAISIILMAIVTLIASFRPRNYNRKRLTPLAGIAVGFVLAAIVFSDSRSVGYSLIGIGIMLAVIDIVIKHRGNSENSSSQIH